ncbi:MAG TPA: T9SS type A sorting domain-containing protein [Bacteroidia bacterium]|nr:T9SS type A sorting domain-containing protein [Bacteroidia bacterium]
MLLVTLPAIGQRAGGNVNGWFDVGEFVYNNSNVNPVDENFYLLQFDNGYYWLDETGAAQPFNTFAAGHIFDVKHDLWSAVPSNPSFPVIPLLPRDPFTWDSLRFNYFYLRGNPDTSITDTLFIYYYCNFDKSDTQIVSSIYSVGMTDSTRLASPEPFDYSELSGKYFRKDTVLLKHTDISAVKSRRFYTTVVNRAFNGSSQTGFNHSGLFGFSLAFKPGSVNIIGDTLFDKSDSLTQANVFGVFYTPIFEPQASVGLPPLILTKIYSENSLWLDKNNRYGGSFNGKTGFIPHYFFHNANFLHAAAHITATSTVSAKEINRERVTVYPNPALPNETLTIETGEELPAQAIITITDLLGRRVLSEVVVNNYTIHAPLAEGIYNIVITAIDNSSAYNTKLIVISR